jgi:hypothetical protein
MPGAAVNRPAGFNAARYLFQLLAVKLHIGNFREIRFGFLFCDVITFRLSQLQQFIGSLSLNSF